MPRGVYERKAKPKKTSTAVQVLKPGELPLDAIPARPSQQRRKAAPDQRVMLAREMLYVMKRILDGS